MKKIMFNDKYGLTRAVLEGRKTMTRRIVPQSVVDYYTYEAEDPTMIDAARFEVGEIVAVAQSYETLANSGYLDKMMETSSTFKKEYCGAGWQNKMFIKADLMPHQIRITDVKVERLQDISHEDCLKEGIKRKFWTDGTCVGYIFDNMPEDIDEYKTPRKAFEALIDKISGKGTWKANLWVYVYEFELIK